MAKRVFIVHGWGGYPAEAWFPWLKRELSQRRFKVEVLAMPETDNPTIDSWVNFLAREIGQPDQETYFVGHSIGGQAILRYLARVGTKIGGAIFVAGWFSLTEAAYESKEDREIIRPWEETPFNFEKVRTTTDNFVAIFSDDDPYVAVQENAAIFREKLGAKILIEKGKEHFGGSSGVKELPIVLTELERISRSPKASGA